MLCLSAKEAADARSEVAAKLYRSLLREAVTSRRIDAAASPAQVLGELVGRSGFSPEAALELHKSLYRQKLNQVGGHGADWGALGAPGSFPTRSWRVESGGSRKRGRCVALPRVGSI
jgi:hypothetical protein